MKALAALLFFALLSFSGCGSPDDDHRPGAPEPTTTTTKPLGEVFERDNEGEVWAFCDGSTRVYVHPGWHSDNLAVVDNSSQCPPTKETQ